MGFNESGQSPRFVTSIVNNWMAEWLSINPPDRKTHGLILLYLDEYGAHKKKILDDYLKLEALYKICNCSAIDIFYLLTRVYNREVSYTDFVDCIDKVHTKITKLKDTHEVKVETERERRRKKLSYEIRQSTLTARKKLQVK